MPVPHSRHVALTEPLARFVDGQVTGGRYASASEVVRAALRLLMEREDARVGAAGGIPGTASQDGQAHG